MSAKKEKKDKIDVSRRGFLTGTFLRDRFKGEDTPRPMAETSNAVSFLRLGNEAYAAGKLEEAVDHYREFLKQEPNNPPGRVRLGLCLYRLSRHLQAKIEFERVLRLVPKDNESLLYLGLCQLRMGKPEKAAAHWKEYFNPQEIPVQREINLQLAFMESGEDVRPDEMADAVENAVAQARRG